MMAHLEDDNETKALVEQKQALSSYLDALFREMPAVEAEPLVPNVLDEVVATEVPTVVATPPEPMLKPLQTDELIELKKEPLPKYFQPAVAFQVLFFTIGKLTLAVPLEHLSGILKGVDEKVTPVPGYAAWHLGLMKYQGATVSIVDTAKLIVPGHRRDIVQDRRKYRYFILLGERRWGLGCHGVAEVVTLDPAEVKWRHNRTHQPWLAGTVIDKMCALIDVEGFLKLLHQSGKR